MVMYQVFFFFQPFLQNWVAANLATGPDVKHRITLKGVHGCRNSEDVKKASEKALQDLQEAAALQLAAQTAALAEREREVVAVFDSRAADAVDTLMKDKANTTGARLAQAALDGLRQLTERLSRVEAERECELEEGRRAALGVFAAQQVAVRHVQRAWRAWLQGPKRAQRHSAACLLQKGVCRWLQRRRQAHAVAVEHIRDEVCELVGCCGQWQCGIVDASVKLYRRYHKMVCTSDVMGACNVHFWRLVFLITAALR
jgi:hypothetical protein